MRRAGQSTLASPQCESSPGHSIIEPANEGGIEIERQTVQRNAAAVWGHFGCIAMRPYTVIHLGVQRGEAPLRY